MKPHVHRFAYFARGIDGFYLPDNAAWEAFALVRADTPEAAWAEQFLPGQRCVRYRLRGSATHDPYPTTGEILSTSDIGRQLQRRGIDKFFLSSQFTPVVRDWGATHNIRLLAPDYDEQLRLENKIWFDGFLRRHEISRPHSAVVTVGHPLPDGLHGRVVVQRADSLGGEGTFYLPSPAEWMEVARTAGLPMGERCLCRRYVPGRPYGITVFMAPGRIALSAIRLQCYYPARDGQARRPFAGIQWIPLHKLTPRVGERVETVFRQLGERLYRRRFFGFANLDFLIDRRGLVWLIECNPRMSAATPQVLADNRLIGGQPVGQLFLDGFARARRFSPSPAVSGLPDTDFAGATLEIISPGDSAKTPREVRREFPSGLYACRGREIAYLGPDVRRLARADEFCLFSFPAVGQRCAPDTTLATIVANFRLYDHNGCLNERGQRLTKFFCYC